MHNILAMVTFTQNLMCNQMMIHTFSHILCLQLHVIFSHNCTSDEDLVGYYFFLILTFCCQMCCNTVAIVNILMKTYVKVRLDCLGLA